MDARNFGQRTGNAGSANGVLGSNPEPLIDTLLRSNAVSSSDHASVKPHSVDSMWSFSDRSAKALVGGTSVAGKFLLGNLYLSDKSLETADLPQFAKDHNSSLSFPQKLMVMLMHVEKTSTSTTPCVAWVLDGRAFVIHDRDALVKEVLPLFFQGQLKYTSFTRKLYRWGFKQVKDVTVVNSREGAHILQAREMIFGHEHFQRDNKHLVTEMRSVTSAGKKRAAAAAQKRKQQKEEECRVSKDTGRETKKPRTEENLRTPLVAHTTSLERPNTLSNQFAQTEQLVNPSNALLQLGAPGRVQHGFELLQEQQRLLLQTTQANLLAGQYLAAMNAGSIPLMMMNGQRKLQVVSTPMPASNQQVPSAAELLLRLSSNSSVDR